MKHFTCISTWSGAVCMAWNTDVSADGKPYSVLTPKSWTVKHEAYRSDSDIQLESDFLISG
nr:hypothetical protein [Escherichia coli]